jgi:hypothetical protein
MNFGFNSNVRVGNAVYHVQTEDRGPSHPFLDTVVYAAGRVVHKRSSSYEDLTSRLPDGEALAQQLHERLAHQHRDVIAQLEAGTLKFNVKGRARAKVATRSNEGLDIHLLNPKSWLASGDVTLEVQLRKNGSVDVVGGAEAVAFLEDEKDLGAPSRARTDANGRATLKFSLPATITDGAALVIRATTGALHGELRFLLKARRADAALVPAAK